jgi:hypothetical protein
VPIETLPGNGRYATTSSREPALAGRRGGSAVEWEADESTTGPGQSDAARSTRRQPAELEEQIGEKNVTTVDLLGIFDEIGSHGPAKAATSSPFKAIRSKMSPLIARAAENHCERPR